LTTNATRKARGSRKVRIVARRRFGPAVEIHARDESKRSTFRRPARLPFDGEVLRADEEPDGAPSIDAMLLVADAPWGADEDGPVLPAVGDVALPTGTEGV
jgi:hypothetical protein